MIATNTQDVHESMSEFADRSEGKMQYFRFNAAGGLGDIDMADWKARDRIMEMTRSYLQTSDAQKQLTNAATALLS